MYSVFVGDNKGYFLLYRTGWLLFILNIYMISTYKYNTLWNPSLKWNTLRRSFKCNDQPTGSGENRLRGRNSWVPWADEEKGQELSLKGAECELLHAVNRSTFNLSSAFLQICLLQQKLFLTSHINYRYIRTDQYIHRGADWSGILIGQRRLNKDFYELRNTLKLRDLCGRGLWDVPREQIKVLWRKCPCQRFRTVLR